MSAQLSSPLKIVLIGKLDFIYKRVSETSKPDSVFKIHLHPLYCGIALHFLHSQDLIFLCRKIEVTTKKKELKDGGGRRTWSVVWIEEQFLLGSVPGRDQQQRNPQSFLRGNRGEGFSCVPLLHCSRQLPGTIGFYASSSRSIFRGFVLDLESLFIQFEICVLFTALFFFFFFWVRSLW